MSQLPYQGDTSNSTQTNVLMQSGWGFISSGGGGASQLTETVTMPATYSSILSLQATTLGFLSGSDPATIPALTASTAGDVIATVYQPTTSNFVISLKLISGTFAANQRWGYSWIALGVKA